MLEILLTKELQEVVDAIADVAGYLWERGWQKETLVTSL